VTYDFHFPDARTRAQPDRHCWSTARWAVKPRRRISTPGTRAPALDCKVSGTIAASSVLRDGVEGSSNGSNALIPGRLGGSHSCSEADVGFVGRLLNPKVWKSSFSECE
jgi:hypothetical protein